MREAIDYNSDFSDPLVIGIVLRYACGEGASSHVGRSAHLDRDVQYIRMASRHPNVNEHWYLINRRTFYDFHRDALTTDMHNELRR